MRVANLISFSWMSLRLDLYSFSSSVSYFISFFERSFPFALSLSPFTSLLLMIVSRTLSPSERDLPRSRHTFGGKKARASPDILCLRQPALFLSETLLPL